MRPVYHIINTEYGKRLTYRTERGSTITMNYDEHAFNNRRDIDRSIVQRFILTEITEGMTQDKILSCCLGDADRVACMSQDYVDYLFNP